jgi:23S rRNA pseudouridine1911/1915/1917 synthase
MSEPFELIPTTEQAGMRVDAWLGEIYPAVPKSVLRKWIDAKNVSHKGRACAKGDRVEADCVYHVKCEPAQQQLQPNAALPLEVVYEDDWLIAVNKPAGMNCQPNGFDEVDTLANALLARWPTLAGIGDSPLTCGILHRIDGGTSGLVLVAKEQSIYEAMRAQFAAREVEKHYRALVVGNVTAPGRLEHLLAHNPRCPGRMVDAAQWHDVKRPMRAVTEYRPMHPVRVGSLACTLLDVTIFTGVTHQIRAQLSFSGVPILGDARYGGQPKQTPFTRHFLHAYTVTFTHPATGAQKTLKAPLTEAYRNVLGHD